MNLAHNLENSAQFFPDRPAVREGGRDTAYGQLNDMAARVASALTTLGVVAGDMVALCAPNSTEWLAFYFGVLKTGAVAVTLSSLLKGVEVAPLVGHAKPKVVFADESKLPALADFRTSGSLECIIGPGGDMDFNKLISMGEPRFRTVERERRDPVAVLYTGGTTGTPKGVVLTQEGLDFSCQSTALYERYSRRDHNLCFAPFNHVFGQIYIMNSTVLCGGCLELMPGFDMERALWLLDHDRLTRFYAVPTVYSRLLAVAGIRDKFSKVRYCFSGGAPLAAGIVEHWKDLTGITIADGYGQTEFMPITYNHFHLERHVPGSVGQPVFGVELEIRNMDGQPVPRGKEGEISVRGLSQMKGYLRNPEATDEALWNDGWLRTGDVGILDDRGFVYIVDRLKDLVITGGENVYPREIEEVLYARSDIEDCAVVGVPDPEWGERVVAFVIPRKDRSIEAASLETFIRSRLASFKVPKEYIRVAELPKSPQGKILKKEVRKLYQKTGVPLT